MEIEPHVFQPIRPDGFGRDGTPWDFVIDDREMHVWWMQRAKLAELATELADQDQKLVVTDTVDLIDSILGAHYSARHSCAVCKEAFEKV